MEEGQFGEATFRGQRVARITQGSKGESKARASETTHGCASPPSTPRGRGGEGGTFKGLLPVSKGLGRVTPEVES